MELGSESELEEELEEYCAIFSSAFGRLKIREKVSDVRALGRLDTGLNFHPKVSDVSVGLETVCLKEQLKVT